MEYTSSLVRIFLEMPFKEGCDAVTAAAVQAATVTASKHAVAAAVQAKTAVG